MVTFTSCCADCASLVPFLASGFLPAKHTEGERSLKLTVVDGLVSVTRKAWFSRYGSDYNENNRDAQ